jgi:hypothetical protein
MGVYRQVTTLVGYQRNAETSISRKIAFRRATEALPMILPIQLNVWSRHAAINHLIPKILNKEGEFSNYLRVL